MKQVTAILLGAGQRGNAYADYALQHPNEFKIVGVAEPRAERLQEFCLKHGISAENSAADWSELLSRPKMADCVLVCTQDQMHCLPVVQSLQKGYHVLCEKPMSPSIDEIERMTAQAKQSQRILSVCHVLRYSPFFSKVKQLLDEGAIGKLISIQHIESVGYWHAAHSFVRGNWRKSEETSPMILAKCCHDLDILLWLAGSHCTHVSSFGGLSHFKAENAPEGAPLRCTDGCKHRDDCPFYAPRFYLEHPKAVSDNFVSVLTSDTTNEGILQALQNGPYGRCVYRCDNDVVDNQVVNLLFENGVTVGMTMCAFTKNCERVINLMGTKAQLRGNMEKGELELLDFASGHTTIIKLNMPTTGHSGSDSAMMKDFVTLVQSDTISSRSDASLSAESHIMALAAEQSRLKYGQPIALR